MLETLGFKWIAGTFVTLIAGGYKYTHAVEKKCASKGDINYLRTRVDAIYDHLINKKDEVKDDKS